MRQLILVFLTAAFLCACDAPHAKVITTLDIDGAVISTISVTPSLASPTLVLVPSPSRVATATLTVTRLVGPTPAIRPLAMTTSSPRPLPSQTPEQVLGEHIGPTPTPTYWPTVTRQILPESVAVNLVACEERIVEPGYLQFVTQQFSLPENYAPVDLVPLSDYFPGTVTLGIPTFVSATIIDPLNKMVSAMHDAGLEPSILSGYRSYSEQYLAWKWWNSQYPERVAIMSARPGRSEHQLGTTVDFGSPALNHLFHVDFADSREGVWLAENAYLFGFTLSYPLGTQDITGFKHEPWHYRYVGIALATELFETGEIVTEWQLANLLPPCIP